MVPDLSGTNMTDLIFTLMKLIFYSRVVLSEPLFTAETTLIHEQAKIK